MGLTLCNFNFSDLKYKVDDFYSDVLQIYSFIFIVDFTLNHLNIKDVIMMAKSGFRTIVISTLVFFCMCAASEAAVFKCTYKGKSIFTDNPSLCISSNSILKSTSSTASASTPSKVPSSTKPTTSAVLTDAVFAPSSFWYTPIPLNTTLDSNSANYVKEFLRQKSLYYNNVEVNTYKYASPVYIAESNTPLVNVGFNNCQNKTWTDPTFVKMMTSVPVPSIAKQSAGGDSEMTIYQPSTDTLWEMWGTSQDSNGKWSACWGGQITQASKSAGLNLKNYGTTATGLPFLGGQITAEELARGEIKHVIGISMVDLETWSIYSYPALRSDGYNPNNDANRIAEGRRFRLDPTINVDNLAMSKTAKIIAKAAQKYGFVVWDKAGAISIRAQNALSYKQLGKADPYPALYEYKPTYAVLNGFPWDKLQFLPMNYGKP